MVVRREPSSLSQRLRATQPSREPSSLSQKLRQYVVTCGCERLAVVENRARPHRDHPRSREALGEGSSAPEALDLDVESLPRSRRGFDCRTRRGVWVLGVVESLPRSRRGFDTRASLECRGYGREPSSLSQRLRRPLWCRGAKSGSNLDHARCRDPSSIPQRLPPVLSNKKVCPRRAWLHNESALRGQVVIQLSAAEPAEPYLTPRSLVFVSVAAPVSSQSHVPSSDRAVSRRHHAGARSQSKDFARPCGPDLLRTRTDRT